MTKISPRAAWVISTPPTFPNLEDGKVGQVVITTADRVKLFTEGEPHRQLAESRRVVPDSAEDAALEVHRALLGLVTLDGMGFRGAYHAFGAIEGFHEALPDGRARGKVLMDL